MSDFVKKTKDILLKCMNFVVACAKKVAASAKKLMKEVKYKTSEWSDLGKRRELISELGERVYSLSRNGIALPDAVDVLIEQLNLIEKNLDDRRTEHAAEKAAFAEQRAAEKAARAAEKAAKSAATVTMPAADVPVKPTEPNTPTMEMPEEVADKAASDSEAPKLQL